MQINIKSYSSKGSLISSVLFFVIGAILTAYADKIMETAYRIVGGVFFLITIGFIISLVIRKKKQEPIYFNRVAMAVITFILAILFFFFHRFIDEAIRFVLGAWILLSGITRLITAIRTDHKASSFIALLVVSILLILLGLVVITRSGAALWVSGIFLMIYSAIEIVGYIFYSKDNVNYEDAEEGETKLLIKDKDEDKEEPKKLKNVKDVKDEDIEEK